MRADFVQFIGVLYVLLDSFQTDLPLISQETHL